MSGGPGEVKQKTLQTTKNGLQRYFLASLGRFELPAFRLGGERSILLSYRDIYEISLILRGFLRFVQGDDLYFRGKIH